MILADPARAKVVFRWAKSRDRWHRRAAAVALIHSARKRIGFEQVMKVSNALLQDKDDMVQKGLGWLLARSREGRSGENCSLFNDDPRVGATVGTADCV